MFDGLGDEELKRLNRLWNFSGSAAERNRGNVLEGDSWYEARIDGVKLGSKNGKPRVQLFFDIEGNRLVKDFWLTEKGIFVFKKFLKKLGIQIEALEQMQNCGLQGRCCRVLVRKKELNGRVWFDTEDVKLST